MSKLELAWLVILIVCALWMSFKAFDPVNASNSGTYIAGVAICYLYAVFVSSSSVARPLAAWLDDSLPDRGTNLHGFTVAFLCLIAFTMGLVLFIWAGHALRTFLIDRRLANPRTQS